MASEGLHCETFTKYSTEKNRFWVAVATGEELLELDAQEKSALIVVGVYKL